MKVIVCAFPSNILQLASDLKSGKKDNESFWLRLGDKYAHIQYIAVRDASGEFIGVLEVTQDINPLQAITGEKRIVD